MSMTIVFISKIPRIYLLSWCYVLSICFLQSQGWMRLKQILGVEIHIDRKNEKLRFSQQKYVEKILVKFGMNNVKPVQISL